MTTHRRAKETICERRSTGHGWSVRGVKASPPKGTFRCQETPKQPWKRPGGGPRGIPGRRILLSQNQHARCAVVLHGPHLTDLVGAVHTPPGALPGYIYIYICYSRTPPPQRGGASARGWRGPAEAMQCNAMQCNATQCNAMQREAIQCNAMLRNAKKCNAMQYNATECNAMQCKAKQCKAMQL